MSGTAGEQDNRSAIRKQWDSFKEFAYNPRAGTVMGRTGKSWAKIGVFYLFYYGFLACLFAVSLTIVLSTLDEYTPKYQTRLQTPGVAIQPKIPSNIEQTSNIRYSLKQDTNYHRLVKQMDEFLYAYTAENQTAEMGFQNCTRSAPPSINQDYSDGQQAFGCTFDKSQLGTACTTSPYGYNDGKPCILIKLNRIIDWFPVGFTNLETASGYTESEAPDLSKVLSAFGLQYKPYLMYTVCYGDEDDDKQNLDSNTLTNNNYYPSDMGLPFVYYPYRGNKRQPGYVNPVVAVQFMNVTRNVKIIVKCKVYALNIQDSKQMAEGFFKFEMQINDE